MPGKNKGGGSKHQQPGRTKVVNGHVDGKPAVDGDTKKKTVVAVTQTDQKTTKPNEAALQSITSQESEPVVAVNKEAEKSDLAADGSEIPRDEVKAERERKRLEKKMKKDVAKVKDPVPEKTPQQQQINETEKSDLAADGSEISRDDVKAERERKKLEKKMKKDVAKVKDPVPEKAPPQQPKKQHELTLQNEDKQNKSKSALKLGPTDSDKSNLQVRFDLQPVNMNTPLRESPKSDYKFVVANSFNVHPAFRMLHAKCERHKILGIQELLREFYDTLIIFVESFSIEEGESFKDLMTLNIQPQFSCLSNNGRRPFPLAVGNLIRQFRRELAIFKETDEENHVRSSLLDWLENSKKENFECAEQAISDSTLQKLKVPGEKNIMTYGRCPVVEKILLDAKNDNLDIHVYVIDNPAINSGKILLENLSEAGIPCTYGQINAIGYLMEHCNYVLMGSSAILNNGRVVAPRGSSLVALLAGSLNIPVLVAAKTCTFVDKVRLDEHLSTALLKEPLETISEDLVTALVTDLRILPPSSAPAVLKTKKLGSD